MLCLEKDFFGSKLRRVWALFHKERAVWDKLSST